MGHDENCNFRLIIEMFVLSDKVLTNQVKIKKLFFVGHNFFTNFNF